MPYISLTIAPTQVVNPYNAQTSQLYKGFSTINPNASNSTLYDHDLIKQDIINQFNISQGERVMDPSFGTVVWQLLFEPFTDVVKQQIMDDVTRIVNSDPRVTVLAINAAQQEYGILLEINLQYIGSNQSEVMKLNFDTSIGKVGIE
jgi:phage baseplate assembly protein W